MKRLLALRALEEECAEAEVSRARRLRQLCLNELRAAEERSAAALRALYGALHAGDRASAIAAEMATAFGPLERNVLERQIAHLNPIVDAAARSWRSARLGRMQIQTMADAAEAGLQRERDIREQKTLDAWFLSNPLRRNADESFQRKGLSREDIAGTSRAGDGEE